jgi:hypothetical protein
MSVGLGASVKHPVEFIAETGAFGLDMELEIANGDVHIPGPPDQISTKSDRDIVAAVTVTGGFRVIDFDIRQQRLLEFDIGQYSSFCAEPRVSDCAT